MNHVLQLADVPRPGVAAERFTDLGRKLRTAHAFALGDRLQEVARQQTAVGLGDVPAAFDYGAREGAARVAEHLSR